jgi:glycosyltransferase involved in cell wall biosynthesis
VASLPLISILIPAYRAQAFIARAVRSVLAQTVPTWEIVIASDDGDDYLSVLRAAGIADDRIRQISTGGCGSGAVTARNAALAAANGDLVTPLDADDLFKPHRFEVLAPLALDAGAAVDNLSVVEEVTGTVISHFLPPDEPACRLSANRFFETSAPAKPLVSAGLALQWDPDCGISDDVVFVTQILDRLGPLPFVSEPLQEYRVVEGSMCHQDDSPAKADLGYRRMLARLDEGSLDIRGTELRATFKRGIEGKISLNQEFGRAREKGFAGTFQHFAAMSVS